MNTTTDTAANAAQATATATPVKANKPQRRMARPAPNDADAAAPPFAATSATISPAPKPATGSKTTAVIALLEREEGATLADLIAATGWLSHTTRAALTGLRKKGHAIERNKRGDESCYRIALRAPGGTKAG